jgi:hypothetical protein
MGGVGSRANSKKKNTRRDPMAGCHVLALGFALAGVLAVAGPDLRSHKKAADLYSKRPNQCLKSGTASFADIVRAKSAHVER